MLCSRGLYPVAPKKRAKLDVLHHRCNNNRNVLKIFCIGKNKHRSHYLRLFSCRNNSSKKRVECRRKTFLSDVMLKLAARWRGLRAALLCGTAEAKLWETTLGEDTPVLEWQNNEATKGAFVNSTQPTGRL